MYENSKIGGAWYIDRYKNQNYSAHNNVIVPLRENEEKYIKLINKELKKFECKISKPKGKYDILSKYSPKNIYIHDLSNLFFNFKKICKTLVKKKVTNIKIFNKKILLNKKEYDQVYLPSCFDINRITIEESCFKINSIRSISHHITIVFKKKNLPNISYSENFDNVFDRGYFRESKKNIFFTGRVRREYKKYKTLQLIKISKKLKNLIKYIEKIKLNKYQHNIIKDDILNKYKSKFIQYNINILETRQFVKSYKLLNRIYK